MFEKLESRYFFSGEILLLNELHIGSGRGDGKTDALVIRDHIGRPFIPGSSLRGVLRSTIERIALSIGLNPCLLIDDNPCVTTYKPLQEKFKELDVSDIPAFLSDISKVCPVCQLFGSTVVASRIKITDLPLLDNNFKFGVRDGVAIDRDTETAKEGGKFDFETVSKQSKFKFELIGENLKPGHIALLAIGIQELTDGNFWLGGNTARGLGKCKLEELEIKYFEGADGLKKYLIDKENGLDHLDNSDFFHSISRLFKNLKVV